MIMTWGIWTSLALVYLIFAVILITCSLFSKTGPLSRTGTPRHLNRHTSQIHRAYTGVGVDDMALARRDLARRALTVRVLGYISVPVICIFPGVIVDFVARVRPGINIPPVVPLIAAITAGLMGTFNAVLLSFDPSIVAVVFWPHWKKEKVQERLRRHIIQLESGQPEPTAPPHKPILGDIEMAETKDETQAVVVTTIHLENADDRGLEFHKHSAMPGELDLENSGTSTTGYNISDLAKIFHGL